MAGWTKLFASIVTSSVWCEDHTTLRVWVAMLAVADSEGIVEGSVPGFANLARVELDEMRRALTRLSSPDPDSRTPDHEGRRIEAIEGGWRILNYASYREKGQAKEGSKAPAMRRYRERRRSESVQVTHGNALPPRVTSDPEERRERREERERITPPTPSKRGIKTSIHPDTDTATARVLLAFNGTFKRRATPLPKLKGEVSRRLREGYTVEQLASVPILADAQTDFPDFRKNAKVHWFLRTGENPRTGQDGRTTGGKDWIGDSLNAAFGTTLWPHHVEAAQAAGVLESLLKLGAKPSQ